MFKALVIAVAAMAFGSSAMAQQTTVVEKNVQVRKEITEGSRHHDRMDHDRRDHDRMDRRDHDRDRVVVKEVHRDDRMDRRDHDRKVVVKEVHRDRGHHYGKNRYHCHNVKKVVYRDGMKKVVYRKKCHSARH